MHPLNQLLTHHRDKASTVTWTEETLSAFSATKAALADLTILTHPAPDVPTSVMTDASDTAIATVLQQLLDGCWCPICLFFLKSLQPGKTRYNTFDRELLAVYQSVKYFRCFREGREFHISKDHKCILSAHFQTNTLHANHDIWILLLSDIRHVKGRG